MTRYRATIGYDGTHFFGFQRQKEGTETVQGAVEKAIQRVVSHEVPIVGAGRTDTGVHATGQVIAFDLDWMHDSLALERAVNAYLPDSVALHGLRAVGDEFHPRFDATSRSYCYTLIQASHALPLQRQYAWVIQHKLDVELLNQSADVFVGRRDFAALGTPPKGNNTVREVLKARWQVEAAEFGVRFRFYVQANAFLYRMVRRIVGMTYDVARGKYTIQTLKTILDDCVLATGVTVAPPQGLVLTRVTYPDDDV